MPEQSDACRVERVIPEGMMPSDETTVGVLGSQLATWWQGLTIAQRLTVYGLAHETFLEDDGA